MSWSTMKSLAKTYDVRGGPDDAGRPRPTGDSDSDTDFDPDDDAASFVPVPVYAPRWTRGSRAETDGRAPVKTTTIAPFDGDEELRGRRLLDAAAASTTTSDGVSSSASRADTPSSASRADTPSSASDWARDDPFAGKLRRYSSLVAVRRDRRSSSGGGTRDQSPSTSDRDEPFYTPETTVQTRHGSGSSQYRLFQHRFHWSENIENGSPWVRHRTKEIFNNVNSKGQFDTQIRETLSNGSEENVILGSTSDTACDDCNETNGNITYEVANKLCDLLKKHNHNNNNNIVSESRCPLSEHFKWTKLYEELVNYGAL